MEDGESKLRHELSSEFLTLKTDVEPPERPWESIIVKSSDVLEATFAVQLYDEGPFGGCKMKASPAGISP